MTDRPRGRRVRDRELAPCDTLRAVSRGLRLDRGDEPPAGGVADTFARQPLVLDQGGLQGADVAVLGAPFDDGASHRPGARYGPRAIRAAADGGRWGRPHM